MCCRSAAGAYKQQDMIAYLLGGLEASHIGPPHAAAALQHLAQHCLPQPCLLLLPSATVTTCAAQGSRS